MIRRLSPERWRVLFDQGALAFLSFCVGMLYAAAVLFPVSPYTGPEPPEAEIAPAAGGDEKAPHDPIPPGAWMTTDAGAGELSKPAGVTSVGSAVKLADVFAGLGYSLERVRDYDDLVPRVFLASLPGDLGAVASVDRRKGVFIKAMLPLVLRVNEEILLERGRVLALRQRVEAGHRLTGRELGWLERLSARYGLDGLDFEGLLERVDIVPVSLALAQAAEESGWGTSRFAVEGNAPFGQWTYDPDLGMEPERRPEGTSHLVRTYGQLLDGVRDYAANLNSHRAYREFRKLRADMRAKGQTLTGHRLAGALERYSARRAAYVKSIRTIIKQNDLREFDRARLKGAMLANLLVAGG